MLTTLVKNGWDVEICSNSKKEVMCIKDNIRVLLSEGRWELYYVVDRGLSFGTVGYYGSRQSQELKRAIEQYKKHGGLNVKV